MTKAVDPETRARMQRVRRSDTTPELAVRSVLRDLGLRYRTCVRTLPGTPDIANQSAGWAIFVHGCYWHGHAGCSRYTIPKRNRRFWIKKVEANRARDDRKARALRALGLRVITVWECETRDPEPLGRRLRRVLGRAPKQMGGNDKTFLRSAKPKLEGPPSGVLRVVDLFSGCGGLTLGVEEAARTAGRATEVRLAVECEPLIAAAYATNFSPAHGASASVITDWFDGRFGDLPTLVERRTRKRVGGVDVLVGGPPCQGHSNLNNHTRGDDPKNALYLVMVRAAEVLRPGIVIIENVPAIENDAGRTVDVAETRLKKLGYFVDRRIVSVADLGVPQLRARHVLMAHIDAQPDIRCAIEDAGMRPRSLRWAIGDLRSSRGATTFDTASRLSPVNRKRAEYMLKRDLFDLPNRKRPPCQRDEHRYKSMYGRLSWTRPAQTITTGFGSPGQGRYLHPTELRTLTPHEAARIQFFPDWYDFSSLTYRNALDLAIGNAVPPKLAFVLMTYALALKATSEEPEGVESAAPFTLAAGQ